ncbi:MAG: hypothetical protein CMJ18_25080 [Phycisphaeraceae bacterium]|nr:hypothetical protein [Phycisphaeraceae bacterium]
MQYKVTNRTDTEQFFVPDITIATDQGDIITAGRGVRASVFLSIRKQLGNPLLENPIRMAGRMLIGEDHARESVAIWPVFESDVDRMKLFVAGLSGETRMIRHPLDGKEVVLRKTLMMVYHTPGSDTRPQVQPIRLRRKTWVMR